jgi:YYY domain-containing protein
VVLLLLLGNLYQARQLWQYLPAVSAPEKQNLSIVERAGAVLSGGGQVLMGDAKLPGDKGRWYFGASRPILHDGPDTPIAEFPFFTFLYADVHPHLLAMPLVLAALTWMLSVLLAQSSEAAEHNAWRRWQERIALWFVAGLVFGALRPTHTWDYYTMLGLGAVAAGWDVWRRRGLARKTMLWIVARAALLVALTTAMYYPFLQWFGTEYTSLELWKGARTPLVDYLTVHGVFLFILCTFSIWESRLWLSAQAADWSSKPLDEMIAGAKTWVKVAIGAVALVLVTLWFVEYQSLTVGLPLLAWIGLLLLRKNQPLHKQIVLGLFGAGVGLTMLVEVLVLKGDVGRSNTVFRFYIQAWVLFSVAASTALIELMPVVRQWSRAWRRVWLGALGLLALAAATYPLIATGMKMQDRWPGIVRPPHNLDGMAYMLGEDQPGAGSAGYAQAAMYDEEGHPLNLATDYAGIRFMQDHVPGTPTIVEGQVTEYRWGARYSIYTGLPTVMGWSWHVRQHNSLLPSSVVEKRIQEVSDFYNTTDPQAALAFLRQYQVEYIVVGDLERAHYSPEGLAKFEQMAQNGTLQIAFRAEVANKAGVVIYAVNQGAK